MHDYGFDLPDTRDEYYDTGGELVAIKIDRHWHHNEDGKPCYFVRSFTIARKDEVISLPIGVSEAKAQAIAREMYPEDAASSEELRELREEEAAERRAGA